ncbi:MAG: CHRD domain-containing protein [Caldilineaceae bacterium]
MHRQRQNHHRQQTLLAILTALSLLIAPLAPLAAAPSAATVSQSATSPVAELFASAQDWAGLNKLSALAADFYNDFFAAQSVAAAPFAALSDLSGNVTTPWVQSTFQVSATTTRSPNILCTGLTCPTISNPNNTTDSNTTNYGAISFPVLSVFANASIRVTESDDDYPAGTFTGFKISKVGGLLDLSLFDNITVRTYLNGAQQEAKSGTSIIDGSLLGLIGAGSVSEYTVGFWTAQPFDAVEFYQAQPIGLNLGGETRIYHAVLEKAEAGPTLTCNAGLGTNWLKPLYPVRINDAETGVTGICAGCEVNGASNVIDSDTSNYATINVGLGLAGGGQIAVSDPLVASYPAGSFAGFVVEDTGGLGGSLLNAFVLETYLDDSQQESVAAGSLLDLPIFSGKRTIGFTTSQPFDEVRIRAVSLVSLNVNVRVYQALLAPSGCLDAVAPTITSGTSVSIPENTTSVTTVIVTGTTPITFSITGGVDNTLFTIDENTGQLSFNAAPDFEAPADSGGDNVYEVTVRASNSAGTDDQTINVTVTNVADNVTPPPTPTGGEVFVKQTATGSGDGSSWDNALGEADLRAALVAGGIIYIAEGTYIVNTGGVFNAASISDGTSVVGGFPNAATGTDVSGYDPETYPTIFDGDQKRVLDLGKGTIVIQGLQINNSNGGGTGGSAIRAMAGGQPYDWSILDTIFKDTTGIGASNAVWILPGGFQASSRLRISNSTFANNVITGGAHGAALRLEGVSNNLFTNDGAQFVIENVSFSNNSSTGGSPGGAVEILTSRGVNFYDVSFCGNHTDNYGGALHASDGDKLVFERCNVTGNSNGAEYGGAFRFTGSDDITINQCTFVNNDATTSAVGAGGAIAVESGSPYTIADSSFYNNSATQRGGAITFQGGGDITIDNSTFKDNEVLAATAVTGGGGVYIVSGAGRDIQINNSVFDSNSVTDNPSTTPGSSGGGAITVGGGASPSSDNNTYYNNSYNAHTTTLKDDIFVYGGGVFTVLNSALQPSQASFNASYNVSTGNTFDNTTDPGLAPAPVISCPTGLPSSVAPTSVAPTIISGNSVSIPENTTVVTTVVVTGTAPITYSIVGGADAAKFTIDQNTGALSFVSAPNFENPTDSGGNNVYDVIVRASNSAGSDDQPIAVTVTDVAEGGPNPIVIYTTDYDADAMAHDDATIGVFGTNGWVMNPANTPFTKGNYAFGADATVSPQGGNYLVGVASGSGSFKATLHFSFDDMVDAAGAPISFVDGQAYELKFWMRPTLLQDNNDGSLWRLNYGASHLVGDLSGSRTITQTFAPLDWTTFTLPFTYSSAWTPTDVVYLVLQIDTTPVLVSGPGGTPITLNLIGNMSLDTGVPVFTPTIVQPGANPAAITIPENTTVITDVNATDDSDSEGSGLTYGLSGVDAGLLTIDSNGNLAFLVAPNYEAPADNGGDNVYNVTVTVTDTSNLTDSVDIAVTVTNVAEGAQGIEYKLVYNSGTGLYEIWMRATDTPAAPGTTGTSQVTIKAPHLMGSGAFTATNITAQVANTAWSVTSRSAGPAADTTADYLSFSLDFPTNDHTAINWQGGQEILMFTLANGGICAGPVSLMENNDPFNVAPNNPGQEIDVTILGSDPGNDFLGNYNLGQGDCDTDGDGVVNSLDADDDGDGILDSVEGDLTVDSDSDGIPDALDVDSDGDGIPDNIEAQTTAGYVAPSGAVDGNGVDTAYGAGGLTPVNTDGVDMPDYLDGDSDNAQGDDTAEAGVTLTGVDADQDGLDDGVDSNAGAFGPVNAGITNPAATYPNTNGSGDVDYRDAVTTAPDLITALGQPAPALMAGVQSNLPVTVTNQGGAPATGPINTTITLPTGVSAPATFDGGNGWNCTTSGQTVTCANAGSINNGSSSIFNVPIVAATGGSPVTFNATTTPVSGESNTGNNAAAPLTTTAPVAAFVDGCFNTTVTLNGAQEVPTNTSAATGSAMVAVNTLANTLDYSLSFSGLTPTMAHIHGFAAPGVSAGIVHTLPGLTSPQTSQWAFAEGDQANILAGLTYFNLHSAAYGSGEIRGQIGQLTSIPCAGVTVPIKVILGGAYQTSTGLMRDQLRSLPDFPLVSPYGDGASISNRAVLTTNHIVDWVLVELRDATTPATVVASQGALLQADGDVVGIDGASAISFSGLANNTVYVAVKHRNHLGVMAAAPITLSLATATVDFTNAATAAYGSNAQRTMSGKQVLWAGNANGNASVIGAGPNNDISTILGDVLSTSANYSFNVNYILTGYRRSDTNLDGKTIAAGPTNDVNIVLTSIFVHPGNGATAANFIVQQQLP